MVEQNCTRVANQRCNSLTQNSFAVRGYTSLISSRAAAPFVITGTVKTGVGSVSVLKDRSGVGYTCSVILSCTWSIQHMQSNEHKTLTDVLIMTRSIVCPATWILLTGAMSCPEEASGHADTVAVQAMCS